MACKLMLFRNSIVYGQRLDSKKLCDKIGIPSRRIKSYQRVLLEKDMAVTSGNNTQIRSLHNYKSKDECISIPNKQVFDLSIAELTLLIHGLVIRHEASKQEYIIQKKVASSNLQRPATLNDYKVSKDAMKYLVKGGYEVKPSGEVSIDMDVHFTVATLTTLIGCSNRFFYQTTKFMKDKNYLSVIQNKKLIGKYDYSKGYKKNSPNTFITYSGWEYLVYPNTYIFNI